MHDQRPSLFSCVFQRCLYPLVIRIDDNFAGLDPLRRVVHEKLSESEELISEKLEEILTGLQYQFEKRLQRRTNAMMDAVIQDAVEARVKLALAASGVDYDKAVR